MNDNNRKVFRLHGPTFQEYRQPADHTQEPEHEEFTTKEELLLDFEEPTMAQETGQSDQMALVMQALTKLLEKDTPSIATPKLGFQPRVHEPDTFSGSRVLNAVQS